MKNTNLAMFVVGTIALGLVGNAHAADVYIEGQISRGYIDDVDGSLNQAVAGFNIDATGVFSYEDSTSLGVEVGVIGLGGNPNLRFGLSYHQFDAELEAVDVNAALTFNGIVLATAAGRISREQLVAAGADIGDEAKSYSLNAYYDFTGSQQFIPYIGIGIGLADIENTEDKELMLSGYLGANYSVTENLYIGLRGSARHVHGPTDLAGINYEDVVIYEVGAVTGIKF